MGRRCHVGIDFVERRGYYERESWLRKCFRRGTPWQCGEQAAAFRAATMIRVGSVLAMFVFELAVSGVEVVGIVDDDVESNGG